MLRVLNQAAVAVRLAIALGAAPGNSQTPDSKQGIPGQTQETLKPVRAKKYQVGKASWYGRLFQNKSNCKWRTVRHERLNGSAPYVAARFLGQGY